jgi:hypothetical protein
MAKRVSTRTDDQRIPLIEPERAYTGSFLLGLFVMAAMVGLVMAGTRCSMYGKETGRCYGNGTCDIGLSCYSGVCVTRGE